MSKRKTLKHKYDVVLVEWIDIATTPGWSDNDKLLHVKPAHCRSIGFLLDKDSDQITICSGYADDEDLADITVFPVGVILSITILAKKNTETEFE